MATRAFSLMSQGEALYAARHSPAADFAQALAWLWRLGSVSDEPDGELVGLGAAGEAEALGRLVRDGGLSAAVILAGRPRAGGSEPATRDGSLLWLAVEADGGWGSPRAAWALEEIAEFLVEALERPLLMLPPLGCVRIDDVPGTAEFQLEGRARGDRRQRRMIRRVVRAFGSRGHTVNFAPNSEALADGERVNLESVWPQSLQELRSGVEAGVVEAVAHGRLGLVPEALSSGQIDYREYAGLSQREAAETLDAVIRWQRENLGEPRSFVAVAWAYSAGTLAAAAERGLPCWLRPAPGPLLEHSNVRETLIGALPGLNGVDFSGLSRLASVGVPPILTLHGASLDSRLVSLRAWRDWPTLARLLLRRDAVRLAALPGVSWVGASSLIDRLRSHQRSAVEKGTPRLAPDSHAVLFEGDGRRREIGAPAR